MFRRPFARFPSSPLVGRRRFATPPPATTGEAAALHTPPIAGGPPPGTVRVSLFGAPAGDGAKTKSGGHGLRALIRSHGLPLAVYYLLFNECCVVAVTCALHWNWLGKGDVASVLHRVGADRFIDIDSAMGKSFSLGPLEVSGRLATNFAIAKVFMSLWTPLQLPFCVATLPTVMRVFRRGPKKGASVGGGAGGAAATHSSATAQAVPTPPASAP